MKIHSLRKPQVSYWIIVGLLIAFAIICIMPFWYVMVSSFSDPQLVREGQFKLLPTGYSLEAYRVVFRDVRFFNGLKITVLRTVIGTVLALSVQTMMAYALSKKLPGRKLFMKLVVVTILFNGGIIPTFLVVQNLYLVDTFFALILPLVFNPWNVVLISFCARQSISESANLTARVNLQFSASSRAPGNAGNRYYFVFARRSALE